MMAKDVGCLVGLGGDGDAPFQFMLEILSEWAMPFLVVDELKLVNSQRGIHWGWEERSIFGWSCPINKSCNDCKSSMAGEWKIINYMLREISKLGKEGDEEVVILNSYFSYCIRKLQALASWNPILYQTGCKRFFLIRNVIFGMLGQGHLNSRVGPSPATCQNRQYQCLFSNMTSKVTI